MTTALYAHVDPAPASGVTSTVIEPPIPLDDDGLAAFSDEIRGRLIKVPANVEPAPGWTVKGRTWSPPSPNRTPAELIGYAELRQEQVRDGGVTINAGTSSKPVNVFCTTDAVGRGLVTGNVVLAGLDNALTFPWVQGTGTVELTATQMVTVGKGVAAFIQATYSALSAVVARIASGEIKTYADVDAAAWPSNS